MSKPISPLVVLPVMLVGVIGYMMLRVLASGGFTSITVSGALVNNGAVIGSDPAAYDGRFIQFGSGPTSAPTTTPTPASQGNNCAPHPSACGFPDASNTGVPPGTSLAPAEGITITQAGAVVQNLKITGCIDVKASNVTIKNVEVISGVSGSFCIFIESGISGTLIEDSTIHGQDSGNNSVEYAIRDWGNGTKVLRVNMYWCTECIQSGGATVQDSYIHDIATIKGAHYEDFYDGGGAPGGLNLQHNTLFNQQSQTAVMYSAADSGPVQNLTINNNLIAGGGYSIYGGNGTGIKITNNRFSTIFFPKVGQYGVAAYFDSSASGNIASGNVEDDTGASLAL